MLATTAASVSLLALCLSHASLTSSTRSSRAVSANSPKISLPALSAPNTSSKSRAHFMTSSFFNTSPTPSSVVAATAEDPHGALPRSSSTNGEEGADMVDGRPPSDHFILLSSSSTTATEPPYPPRPPLWRTLPILALVDLVLTLIPLRTTSTTLLTLAILRALTCGICGSHKAVRELYLPIGAACLLPLLDALYSTNLLVQLHSAASSSLPMATVARYGARGRVEGGTLLLQSMLSVAEWSAFVVVVGVSRRRNAYRRRRLAVAEHSVAVSGEDDELSEDELVDLPDEQEASRAGKEEEEEEEDRSWAWTASDSPRTLRTRPSFPARASSYGTM